MAGTHTPPAPPPVKIRLNTHNQNDRKPRGAVTQWKRGQSGNPAGRPRGSRNKLPARLLEALEDGADDVIARMIKAAKGGDVSAGRIILDRVLPIRLCRAVPDYSSMKLTSMSDAVEAMGAITAAALRGELTPDEAVQLGQLVDTFRRMLESSELEGRLASLEQRLSGEPL